MSADHISAIKSMYSAAIERVRASDAVRRSISLDESGFVRLGDSKASITEHGVFVIAIGKAAVGMCTAVCDVLGDRLASAVVVTKDERANLPDRVRLLRGSHPVPDERSVLAGREVLSFARSIPAGALVVCLISGGGSALVEVPRNTVTLDDLRAVTSALLGRGASIREINAVRSRLSAFKAGGLLRALNHVRVHNVIVSDVLGDDLQSIASGPTIPPVDLVNAELVLADYNISVSLPPTESAARLTYPPTLVVANISLAIDAVATHATALGYQPFILTRGITAEARETGRIIAEILKDTENGRTSLTRPICVIAGGETVVTLRGRGVGGRNTEAALAAAVSLSGARSSTVGFLATDGDDGTSGAAGAIVSGQTIPADSMQRARTALLDNDSFTFLERLNATYITGPTGTNVNDLVIGIVE